MILLQILLTGSQRNRLYRTCNCPSQAPPEDCSRFNICPHPPPPTVVKALGYKPEQMSHVTYNITTHHQKSATRDSDVLGTGTLHMRAAAPVETVTRVRT